eukprot:COSAG02_NODE_31622_length_530_cov_1.069606_1_plen_139_part_10
MQRIDYIRNMRSDVVWICAHRDSVVRFPELPDEVLALSSIANRHAGRRWHCRQGCHGRMWLVDNLSGFIDTHGAKWAIACGPPTSFAGRMRFPALGSYEPSVSAATTLEWVDHTPVETAEQVALQGLDIEDLHLGRYVE